LIASAAESTVVYRNGEKISGAVAKTISNTIRWNTTVEISNASGCKAKIKKVVLKLCVTSVKRLSFGEVECDLEVESKMEG